MWGETRRRASRPSPRPPVVLTKYAGVFIKKDSGGPVAAESDLKQQNNAVDAWLAIDACAVDVRRKAAVETTDARALVAELATTAVALRRLDPLRRKRVALQAVHVHLPLGELLGDTQAKSLSAQQQVAFRSIAGRHRGPVLRDVISRVPRPCQAQRRQGSGSSRPGGPRGLCGVVSRVLIGDDRVLR